MIKWSWLMILTLSLVLLDQRQHKIEAYQYTTGKNRTINVYPVIPKIAPLMGIHSFRSLYNVTIQRSYPVAQHIYDDHNKHHEGSLWYSRTFHRTKNINLLNGQRRISIMNLSNMTNQKFNDSMKINHVNLRRSLISNTRIFLLKNELLTNNRPNELISTTVFSNPGDRIPRIYFNRTTPEPDAIEKSPLTTVFPNPGEEKILKTIFNRSTPESDAIEKSPSITVFPNLGEEKIPKTVLNKLTPEPDAIEKCSVNGVYCIEVDNYPRQELLNILRNSKFTSTNQNNIDYGESDDIDRESRLVDELRPVCESKEEVIFPEAGLTKNNEWLFIIQVDKNTSNGFRQGVKVDTCLDTEKSNEVEMYCKFNDFIPQGFSSVCVQKYIYKRLITFNNSREIFQELFLFPSCCSCMYRE